MWAGWVTANGFVMCRVDRDADAFLHPLEALAKGIFGTALPVSQLMATKSNSSTDQTGPAGRLDFGSRCLICRGSIRGRQLRRHPTQCWVKRSGGSSCILLNQLTGPRAEGLSLGEAESDSKFCARRCVYFFGNDSRGRWHYCRDRRSCRCAASERNCERR